MQPFIRIVIWNLVTLLLISSEAWSETVTVGLYQNRPLVFTDEKEQPQGIYVDVLETIAEQEGWTLRYIRRTWGECLDLLAEGKIDLLTAIGYSRERSERFDFTETTLITNWGQVYVREGLALESAVDLSGKTLAVVESDIYYSTLKKYLDSFSIAPQMKEVSTFKEVLTLVAGGKVDAGLLPHVFGRHHEKSYKIIKSPVKFGLTELRFAAPKGKHARLLEILDTRIRELTADKSSVFHDSQSRWLEGVNQMVFPKWLNPVWIVSAIAGTLFVLVVGNALLQWQVRIKSRELEKTIAAKERYESELRIAHDIQMSFIPRTFPPLSGYALDALIQPARAVGGDFYDVFLLDGQHVCFLVADVSGKGVPAALFMARINTLFRSLAHRDDAPADIMAAVNRKIAMDNDEGMFVTAFMGILHLPSGTIRFANAGHNPPVVVDQGKQAILLEEGGSAALGVDDEVVFAEGTLELKEGRTLFLYTDGVTEAVNPEGEMFGDDALIASVTAAAALPAADLTAGLQLQVQAFAGDREQFDDITMLVLQKTG